MITKIKAKDVKVGDTVMFFGAGITKDSYEVVGREESKFGGGAVSIDLTFKDTNNEQPYSYEADTEMWLAVPE